MLQVYRGHERLTSHDLLPENAANEYRTNDADLPAGDRYQPWDAARVRDSPGTVQRVWSKLGFEPHRIDTSEISNDPRFTEELIDVVASGLEGSPRARAVMTLTGWRRAISAYAVPSAASIRTWTRSTSRCAAEEDQAFTSTSRGVVVILDAGAGVGPCPILEKQRKSICETHH